MESVNVLFGNYSRDHLVLVDMLRERKLDDQAVYVAVRINIAYYFQQFFFRGLFGKTDNVGSESSVRARLFLVGYVCLAGGIVAYQNGRE